MLKKMVIRLFVLALVIALLNIIYNAALFKKDLQAKCAEVVKIHNTQAATDIYYFGESSNITYRETDSIKNSISELANLFYPGLKVTNINQYATHGGIYRSWLSQIDLKSRKPKALVVTMNLRSFDATWIHSKLETQLQESLVLTKPYPNIINRFLLALQAFDNKTEQQREKDMLTAWATTPLIFPYPFKYKTVTEWDYAMAQGGHLKPDGSWDTEKITLACHYIKAYAFNLNEHNPRIKDFDEIALWCGRNNISLYLNLMAENIDYADSLVGKELVFLMRQNRNYLVKRYNKNNCRVIDNLELVPGKEFIDQNWTTEHYGYKGRMTIAANVAAALKEQFKTDYKKAY